MRIIKLNFCRYVIATLLSLTMQPLWAVVTEATLQQDRFGTLAIYHPVAEPKGLVLFLSGSDGWTPALVAMARAVAELDYLVAGIDSNRLLPAAGADPACGDAGADLAALGRGLQERYQLPVRPPLLLGYADGATLVYVALAQAPAAVFHAGVSLDFCPQLPSPTRLCQNRLLVSTATADGQGSMLTPTARLPTGWFAFQVNPACDVKVANDFIDRVGNARRVTLVAPGQPFAQSTAWTQAIALLQWLDPRLTNQVSADSDVNGVPLVEVPAAAGTSDKSLAIFLSGDGGWAALDKAVAAELASHGIATVGWDTLRYFWNARTPDEAGRDLERVIRHYLQVWNRDRVLLIGYSFGADVLPFMANRLSSELRARVRLVALLGLSRTATFEFHLSDWLGGGDDEDALPVPPEVARLDWSRRLCLYGVDEDDSACPELASSGVIVQKLPGDHHFAADYGRVAQCLLAEVKK